jgi:exonuclease III
MRISTFNINNINRRLPNLLAWLHAAKPNIVCLQELKCPDAEFPAETVKGRWIPLRLAWSKDLERRCHTITPR